MQREKRFDAQEARQGSNPNPDLTRQQVAVLDQFLDSHPDIDRTLDKNPWLIRNAQYIKEHPELQTFLNQHPELKEESAETPAYLMEREKRFDAREAGRGRDRDFDRDRDRDASRGRDVDRRANPNPDLTNREVATVDYFLDRHKDIAKSLEKKPELVNDHGYLKHHKDLDEFLSEHPAVREELRENPSYFMHRETQFEARNMDRDVPDRDRDRVRDRDRDRDTRDVDNDLNKKELQDMDRFLDKHKNIDKDLQKNPSLVNDRDYLKHHKQLEAFLSKNPQVGEELRENPTRFMQKQEQLEARSHRMNNRQPATKPKTKVEQKEEMHSATPH
jgi:phage-related protein